MTRHTEVGIDGYIQDMIGATVLSGALVMMTPASPRGQAATEVFTATAAVKTAGGASASAPVT